jgi:hypothetical protein
MEATTMIAFVVVKEDGSGVIVKAASKKQAMAQVVNAVDAWRD